MNLEPSCFDSLCKLAKATGPDYTALNIISGEQEGACNVDIYTFGFECQDMIRI